MKRSGGGWEEAAERGGFPEDKVKISTDRGATTMLGWRGRGRRGKQAGGGYRFLLGVCRFGLNLLGVMCSGFRFGLGR